LIKRRLISDADASGSSTTTLAALDRTLMVLSNVPGGGWDGSADLRNQPSHNYVPRALWRPKSLLMR
jgi:hypothetical protein